MTYQRTLREWLAISLSVITALALLVFLTDARLFDKIFKRRYLSNKLQKMLKNWKDDEEL